MLWGRGGGLQGEPEGSGQQECVWAGTCYRRRRSLCAGGCLRPLTHLKPTGSGDPGNDLEVEVTLTSMS